MKNESQLILLLPTLILFHIFPFTSPKSVIESCTSSNTCLSLLSYHLPWDSKLSEIAYRFHLNISQIVSSNPTIDKSSLNDIILPTKTFIKIPISCHCVGGIRRSVSTLYSIKAADTLELISEGFGGLVSAEQIRSFNGITDENYMMNGESIVIPLPCTCFENKNDGLTTVYLSYVVQNGDNLESIGAQYGTTVSNLEGINGLGHPQIDTGDILAVPIVACSSANMNWINESLIVPNGSYALTANDCIRCNCLPENLQLQCMPSTVVVSCSHLQCKGSNLFIGDILQNKTAFGCNVTACIYRGHFGRKIYRSLEKFVDIQCSDSPFRPPLSDGSPVPFLLSSPLPSPAHPPAGFASFSPIQQKGNSFRDRKLLKVWHLFCLLVSLFIS